MVNKISVFLPVNRGSQEDFGAHVTLQALEKSRKIARVVPANQASEPQIVFPWASISPSAVARVTHGRVKAMAGRPAPRPHSTLQGFELSHAKLRAPCISTPALLVLDQPGYTTTYLPKINSSKESIRLQRTPTDLKGMFFLSHTASWLSSNTYIPNSFLYCNSMFSLPAMSILR